MNANWKEGGQAYLPALSAAEMTYGMPADLLARLCFQECSWRAGVIDGNIKSPAGAVGIMQLEPQFFPGAGLSWRTDIETAAEYLSNLEKEFSSWKLALAAYNAGPGNVRRYRGVPPFPETENYVAQIMADVPGMAA